LACELPCCGTASNLNALKYDWPCAFGSFQLGVMNPNIPEPPSDFAAKLEKCLSTPVKVVRCHI
jgi:hypothetical protein